MKNIFICLCFLAGGIVLSITSFGQNVLLIWDVNNTDTQSLKAALERSGMTVTLSATDERFYNGTNPSLSSFDAVVHLNGTTYSQEMALPGQTALLNFVRNGGGYLHQEWNAFEISQGRMGQMQELTLFERQNGKQTPMSYNKVASQIGHLILQNVQNSFSVLGGSNVGGVREFASNPATVLMKEGANDAVAVREYGNGRIVGFHHAGNYNNYRLLSNPDIQQLYINGVRWASKNTIPSSISTSFQQPVACAAYDAPVDFIVNGYFGESNIFTAQLSNASGAFDSPIPIGDVAGTTSGTIQATIPYDLPAGDNYRIRVVSSDPQVIGSDNGVDITITQTRIFYFDGDGDGFGGDHGVRSCVQPLGYSEVSGDCDDSNASINPGATEICDNLDNDCDGQIDENLLTTFYLDQDGDGFGVETSMAKVCSQPEGFALQAGDCNDLDATIYPGAPELCDGKDHNCDGNVLTAPSFTFTVFHVSCNGGSDGSIAIHASGGTEPYTYSINGGAYTSSNIFVSLMAGIYKVKVKGNDGCETPVQTISVGTKPDVTPPTITCPAPITVNTDPDKCGAVVTFNKPAVSDNCSGETTPGGVHILNRGERFYDYANNVLETQNSPGLPLTFNPTDGNKMAVFLQNGASTHYLYQDLNLPINGPIYLSFDLKYTNHNGSFSSSQFIAVEIRNPATNAIERTLFRTNPGAPAVTPMTKYSFDLSEFAGKRVRLELINATINSYYLDVLLDNVNVTGNSIVNGSFESGDYTGWTVFSSNASGGTWGIGSGPGLPVVLTQTAGLPSGSVFPVGITTNTFVATDAAGNKTSCSFAITVEDKQKPTVKVKPITASLDDTGKATITAEDVNDNSSDPCGIESLSLNKFNFACEDIGANTVTLTVIDKHGNASSADVEVTIEDNIKPIVLATDITVKLDANGAASILPQDVDGGSSDACGIRSLVLSQSNFTCEDLGSNTVTLTATDVNGNFSTADLTVTVIDDQPPVIESPADIVLSACEPIATWLIPDASDNCSVLVSQTGGPPSGSEFANETTTTITYTATDPSGNETSCSFTVTRAPVLASSLTTDKSILYFGLSSDQSAKIVASAQGGTPPYTISISMDRPLNCNVVTSAGDETWTGDAGTANESNTACPASGSGMIPVSSSFIGGIPEGGSYSVIAALMQDAVITATVTDADGCVVQSSINIQAEDVRCYAGNSGITKVSICHQTGSAKNPCKSICVDEASLADHLAHGDYVGNCTSNCIDANSNSSARSTNPEGPDIDLGEEISVDVYPSPMKSFLSITVSNPSNQPVKMNLMDMRGVSMLTTQPTLSSEGVYQVDTEQFSRGLYILRVNVGMSTRTVKLIKE